MKQESIPYNPKQFQRTDLQNQQYLPPLTAFAVAGQLFLVANAWLLPAVSEFSLVGDNMSELVLGKFGWVQTTAFVIAGLGTLGIAFGLWKTINNSLGSLIGSLLIAVYGLGAILVAFFPTDRIDSPADVWAQSPTGLIHISVSIISFISIIVAMFVLTWQFAKDSRWRSLTIWSGLFSSAALPLFLGQGECPWVGLLQRLLVAAITGWLIMTAFRARSIAADARKD